MLLITASFISLTYSQAYVAAEHIESCGHVIELLDLDVKNICAQLVYTKNILGEAFYTQGQENAQCLLDLLQAVRYCIQTLIAFY
jgi:hypothetical protein